MPIALGVVAAISVASTVDSTIQQKKAADSAAQTSTQIADYNAKLDRSEAAQIDLDSLENIRAMRRDAATYMSRQALAYVGSGVMANTGSPLAVRAATAGRFAQKEHQVYADAQAKEQMLESKAQAGIYEGAARADQYHKQGVAAVMSGAGKVAGQLYGDYKGGLFSGSGNAGFSSSPSFGGGATDLPSFNTGAIA